MKRGIRLSKTGMACGLVAYVVLLKYGMCCVEIIEDTEYADLIVWVCHHHKEGNC